MEVLCHWMDIRMTQQIVGPTTAEQDSRHVLQHHPEGAQRQHHLNGIWTPPSITRAPQDPLPPTPSHRATQQKTKKQKRKKEKKKKEKKKRKKKTEKKERTI